MRYQIAVLGSHREDLPKETYKIAEEMGAEIARRGHILVTGASRGISGHAARGAKSAGGVVLAISPQNWDDESSPVSLEDADVEVHSGFGLKGRNVLTVRSADGIIIINGGIGTLNEAAIAEGEGKPVLAIEGTGGCADILRSVFSKLNPGYEKIRYGKPGPSSLDSLVEMIENDR